MSPAPAPKPTLVWLRHDLRLADNPALWAATQRGWVIPVFIWAPEEEAPWPPGAASRWWLHQSLAALDADLKRAFSRLIVRKGPAIETLLRVAHETGAKVVCWNRRYEPAVHARDERVTRALEAAGVEVQSFNGGLLNEPWTVRNKSGKPFQVFTPFWSHCLGLPAPPEPLPRLERIQAPAKWPHSMQLEDLGLKPVPDWAGGLRATWPVGERAALKRLDVFLAEGFDNYEDARNRPDQAGTSRLSPHLHFGEISPRQVWHTIHRRFDAMPARAGNNRALAARLHSQFLAELGWREFAHHLLHHFPHTESRPLRAEFTRFRWRHNEKWLNAWQQGTTGFPLVDAGMRELWKTGWMHNRVRMVVASFLVKDLLISWSEGARWFWDTLVDADLAQNTLGWQWSAGCGADAAPFFRIFNPSSQGEKFDPQGNYIRLWVPEIAALPDKWIHKPHKAPAGELERAGIELGRTYPEPIVSHAVAREVALEAYGRLRA